MKAPVPTNEPERLQALRSSGILDSAPERSYDQLTELAAGVCGAPIAILSLIDSDRQWFKSKLGINLSETSRDIAFCSHVILDRDVLVVPDAKADQRFADNPDVTPLRRIAPMSRKACERLSSLRTIALDRKGGRMASGPS